MLTLEAASAVIPMAELAAIMWRQRRVLLAEGAAINAGLLGVVKGCYNNPFEAAAPFEQGLWSSKEAPIGELVTATPDQISERQRRTTLDLQATERAAAILRKGGANAYDKALKALPPDSRDWWREWIEDEADKANADGLADFIRNQLLPYYRNKESQARHQPAIRAQTLGEGLQVHRLEKLNRYETHLDRKFERTLAMLVKLRELR